MPTVLQVVLLFWSSTLLALGDFRLSTFSVVCVQHMQSDTHTKKKKYYASNDSRASLIDLAL